MACFDCRLFVDRGWGEGDSGEIVEVIAPALRERMGRLGERIRIEVIFRTSFYLVMDGLATRQ